MPKTKTDSKNKRTIKKADKIAPMEHASCDQSCYWCTIFKVMIGLFIVMIIFWVGFSFGAIENPRPIIANYRAMSVNQPNSSLTADRMCADAPTDQLASKINNILKTKEGVDFDKEFLLEMTLNHQSTLEMAKLALTKSLSNDVKKFAQKLIDIQTKEIDQMKLWQSKLPTDNK